MNATGTGSDPAAALYRAMLKLETPEECYAFLEDLCTISELMAMEQRFQVAQLLDRGSKYQQVLEQTGASSTTISRVNRSLQFGAGGYRIVLDRMGEDAP